MMERGEIIDCVNSYISYFEGIDDITDYYLSKKLERLNQRTYHDITGSVFNTPSISPLDMDISIEEINGNVFNQYTTQIATFPIESQIGRRITIGVKENTTNTFLGFIRISSPVSSIKPRNNFFGTNLKLDVVNKHFYNGQTIVPVQPFGFNYLGGKLLSLICCSNEVKEIFNKRYDTDIQVFETTSLYGTSKSSSMYDGLEPYIKFKGLTESQNLLTPTDEIYFLLRDKVREYYGNPEWNNSVVNPKGSSPKTRELNKVLSILKNELYEIDVDLHKTFVKVIKEKSTTYQQKRYYLSTFGNTNVVEHILNGTPLDNPNPDKYNLENIINYWKKKSYNRWSKLQSENRIKTRLEYYTINNLQQGLNFDIIR